MRWGEGVFKLDKVYYPTLIYIVVANVNIKGVHEDDQSHSFYANNEG